MATISLRLELYRPTVPKQQMYQKMTEINKEFANWLLWHPEIGKATSKIYKEFSDEAFPSAVVNQTIREVKSQKRNQKTKNFSKMWCCFNNQNLKVEKKGEFYTVSFPTLEKRVGVPVIARPFQIAWLKKIIDGKVKQGSGKLYRKKKKWYVAIPVSWEAEEIQSEKIMGVDLGLRYVAVSGIGTSSLFFNGSSIAHARRQFNAKRRKLGKAKKIKAIKKSKGKESRWMKDQNHKISRQIVNYALSNGVGVIRMEDLTGIRNKGKKQKKKNKKTDHGRNLHSWSFSQLRKFIKYKAEMVGILFELVNPKYTSQTCKCGHRSKANRNGLQFRCKKCGYHCHADLNGAINIAKAISGLTA